MENQQLNQTTTNIMSKSKNWSGGRLKEIKEKISRKYNGLPVIDAENDLRLLINAQDIKESKDNQKDFENCVFACSCKRMFSSGNLLLMRSVAYLELPNEKGERRVERFLVSKAGKNIIKDYDSGIMPEPGASFVFRAPEEYETLEYNRKKQKEFWQKRKKEKKRAKINGDIYSSDSKKVDGGRGMNKKIEDPKEESLDIRDGRGLAQFKWKN